MVTFYVHHIIKEGHEPEAMKMVNDVTEWVKDQAGLVFRQVIRSQENPRQVDTIISWESIDHYKAYKQTSPQRFRPREVEMEHMDVMTATMFDVEDSLNL